jgi:hypothetical protein
LPRDSPATAHAAVDSRAEIEQSDRKPKRKPSTPQSTTVLQTGTAVTSGPLPEVLSASLPETFPTLSAARRGKRRLPGPSRVCFHVTTASLSAAVVYHPLTLLTGKRQPVALCA